MAEDGLDPRTWFTIVGVFVAFFALPALTLEHDRRKRRRKANRSDDLCR